MKPKEPIPILKGSMNVVMSGRDHGDCSMQNKPEVAVENISALAEEMGICQVFMPRPFFVNRIACPTDSDISSIANCGETVFIQRTTNYSDGALVVGHGVGGVICNADCPVGIVYKPKTDRFIILHLGLKCMISDFDLIEGACQLLGEKRSKLWFWAGGGTRGCCYGFNPDNPALEELHRSTPEYQKLVDNMPPELNLVAKGPRRGQIAVDPLWVALIKSAGFDHVSFEETCTSCAGLPHRLTLTGGDYFSNVRDVQKTKARNCFMAWLP